MVALNILPAGYQVRSPVQDDLDAVAAVVAVVGRAEYGEVDCASAQPASSTTACGMDIALSSLVAAPEQRSW